MKVRIGRTYTFSAAHSLEGHPKCGRVHGHNYKVEVCVRTRIAHPLNIDFYDIDRHMKAIIRMLDHRDLNEIIEYPTAENICEFIYQRLKPFFDIEYVKVWENDRSFAEVIP